jgi:hypothetical protein
MKWIKLLVILFLYSSVSFAQRTPEFEFTLYGQDSRGHRDSVVIGYDTSARYGIMVTAFGEVDNTAIPYDSIFEMRLDKNLLYNRLIKTSKKIICRASNSCSQPGLNSEEVHVLIHSKYPPVTFSWDSRRFLQPCIESSFLARGYGYFNYQYDPGDSINNIWDYTLLTSFLGLTTSSDKAYKNYKYQGRINNGTTDTIWSIIQNFRNTKLLPYYISTQEINTTQLKGFPNPCINQINYDFPSSISGEVVVVNALGQEVFKERIRNVDKYGLQTAGYGIGVHFMYLISEDGRRYSTMFMKNK